MLSSHSQARAPSIRMPTTSKPDIAVSQKNSRENDIQGILDHAFKTYPVPH
jgi:hypothetical protein